MTNAPHFAIFFLDDSNLGQGDKTMTDLNQHAPGDPEAENLLGDPELVVRRMEEIASFPYMRKLTGQRLTNTEEEVLRVCEKGFASLQADTRLKHVRL
ncbi:MAG: hypothetical protein HQL99_14255 [Magnetococcales bacterium]|nr:hypothetical protein [Magnetococcales bacterium]